MKGWIVRIVDGLVCGRIAISEFQTDFHQTLQLGESWEDLERTVKVR